MVKSRSSSRCRRVIYNDVQFNLDNNSDSCQDRSPCNSPISPAQENIRIREALNEQKVYRVQENVRIRDAPNEQKVYRVQPRVHHSSDQNRNPHTNRSKKSGRGSRKRRRTSLDVNKCTHLSPSYLSHATDSIQEDTQPTVHVSSQPTKVKSKSPVASIPLGAPDDTDTWKENSTTNATNNPLRSCLRASRNRHRYCDEPVYRSGFPFCNRVCTNPCLSGVEPLGKSSRYFNGSRCDMSIRNSYRCPPSLRCCDDMLSRYACCSPTICRTTCCSPPALLCSPYYRYCKSSPLHCDDPAAIIKEETKVEEKPDVQEISGSDKEKSVIESSHSHEVSKVEPVTIPDDVSEECRERVRAQSLL